MHKEKIMVQMKATGEAIKMLLSDEKQEAQMKERLLDQARRFLKTEKGVTDIVSAGELEIQFGFEHNSFGFMPVAIEKPTINSDWRVNRFDNPFSSLSEYDSRSPLLICGSVWFTFD